MKARLLFHGTAFAIVAIAFAVGYRTPGALRTYVTKVEPALEVAHVSTDHALVTGTSGARQRENLQVEGFAKIGFAEMEELLTTASPQEREQWARKLGALPDSPLKPIALIAFYTAWLDLKPEEAVRSLRNFPDLLYRLNVFDALQAAVPTTLLPQLIEVISGFSKVERGTLLPLYLERLAQTDPAATARLIDSDPKLVSEYDVSATLISAWARDDIEAARTWLEASRFFTNPFALRALVESWWAKDPAAVQNYVLLHRDREGFDEAINVVAGNLFSTSPEHTREFLNQFEDQRASPILRSMVWLVARDQVANFAMWASTLPRSLTEETLGPALAQWHTYDSRQALDWLRARPATERDSLFIQMVRSREVMPVTSDIVALAFDIRDPQKREEILSTLARSLNAEAGDATEHIRALGLPTFQANRLLELRPAPRE